VSRYQVDVTLRWTRAAGGAYAGRSEHYAPAVSLDAAERLMREMTGCDRTVTVYELVPAEMPVPRILYSETRHAEVAS